VLALVSIGVAPLKSRMPIFKLKVSRFVPVRLCLQRTSPLMLVLLMGCGADMRRNEPTTVFVSSRSLEDTSACLLPSMNAASYNLTNDISKLLNTAPVVVNQVRILEPKKIYEIGPVASIHSDWYVARLVALDRTKTRIEFLPSTGMPQLTAAFEPALARCAS
jgi:hypothetical protein